MRELAESFSTSDRLGFDLPESMPWENPFTGETELIETGPLMDAAVDRLAEKNREQPWHEQVSTMARALRRNDAAFRPWSTILQAGSQSIGLADLAGPGRGDDVNLARATRGFQLYKGVHAEDPFLVDRHLPDAADRRFYRVAAKLQEYQSSSDEEAVRRAHMWRTNKADSPERPSINLRDAEAHAVAITDVPFYRFARSAENRGAVYSEVHELANIVMTESQFGPTQALEVAAEMVGDAYSVVDGWAVRVNNRNIPSRIDEALTNIKGEWIEGADDWGYVENDIVAIPLDSAANLWELRERFTGMPVVDESGDGHPVRFTIHQIHETLQGMDDQAREHAVGETVRRADGRLSRSERAAEVATELPGIVGEKLAVPSDLVFGQGATGEATRDAAAWLGQGFQAAGETASRRMSATGGWIAEQGRKVGSVPGDVWDWWTVPPAE